MKRDEHEAEEPVVQVRPIFRVLAAILVIAGFAVIPLAASDVTDSLAARILFITGACSMILAFGWVLVFGRWPYYWC
ncbi:MAG: hypothetical protein WD009_09665 [Phycisphaeraceae bacterium]